MRDYFITKISLWSLSIGAVASTLPTDAPDPLTLAALLENYGPESLQSRFGLYGKNRKSERNTTTNCAKKKTSNLSRHSKSRLKPSPS